MENTFNTSSVSELLPATGNGPHLQVYGPKPDPRRSAVTGKLAPQYDPAHPIHKGKKSLTEKGISNDNK